MEYDPRKRVAGLHYRHSPAICDMERSCVDTPVGALQSVVNSIFWQLKGAGRIPARLNEEEYADVIQEGVLVALTAARSFDSARGSLRNYLHKPVERALLRYAWKQASLGITGAHGGGIHVYSLDADSDPLDEDEDISEEDRYPIDYDPPLSVGDPAEYIEALENISSNLT